MEISFQLADIIDILIDDIGADEAWTVYRNLEMPNACTWIEENYLQIEY